MKSKLIVIIVLIILVIVFGAWYLYYSYSQQLQQGYQTSNDTTTGILDDLNQIPDDSSVDNQMNSLDQDFQNF